MDCLISLLPFPAWFTFTPVRLVANNYNPLAPVYTTNAGLQHLRYTSVSLFRRPQDLASLLSAYQQMVTDPGVSWTNRCLQVGRLWLSVGGWLDEYVPAGGVVRCCCNSGRTVRQPWQDSGVSVTLQAGRGRSQGTLGGPERQCQRM